ncbi:hypothetical protein EYR40_006028 [Pleurotus pulmonarius]|nr:hypothetical protein EYR36_005590 [Pleurotus pulmonarius]KAF4602811.1 hypothetical protein EYR40_006028 [Pleurotus pulmonarius]
MFKIHSDPNQLDVLETNIRRTIMDIRVLKNERSYINKVHPEILAKIFEDLVDMDMVREFGPPTLLPLLEGSGSYRQYHKQPPAVYVVSVVCRRWRNVAAGFPRLWSSIRQNASCPNKLFRINLERSKARPLRIFVYDERLKVGAMSNATEVVVGVAPACHARRVQQLHLSTISLLSCSRLKVLVLPNLECLTLDNIFDERTIDPPLTIFKAPTPRLKRLTLLHCPFFPNQAFSGLTYLCFASDETSAWPLDYFLNVLGASPQLEELYFAQSTFPVWPKCSKVLLGCLRILSIGKYRDTLSDLLDMLIIPQPIEFIAWGTDTAPKLQSILGALYPAQPSDQHGSISELRVTAIKARSHTSSIFPNPGYTIVSDRDRLQVDGRFTQDEFLFAVPTYIDVSNVKELWLAVPFTNEPHMQEWRRFLKTVPAVVTLVIGCRSSAPILSALTLSDEEKCKGCDLLLPKLEAIHIFADQSLSFEVLSLFAEQRVRLGNKLKMCDVKAERESSPSYDEGWDPVMIWGPPVDEEDDDWEGSQDSSSCSQDSSSWRRPDDKRRAPLDRRGDALASSSSAGSGPKDPSAEDLKKLGEYIDEVRYSKGTIDPLRGVLKTPVWNWVERL